VVCSKAASSNPARLVSALTAAHPGACKVARLQAAVAVALRREKHFASKRTRAAAAGAHTNSKRRRCRNTNGQQAEHKALAAAAPSKMQGLRARICALAAQRLRGLAPGGAKKRAVDKGGLPWAGLSLSPS